MQNKVIIFDYDDTFLPSSELTKYANEKGLNVFKMELNPNRKTLMAQIDMAVCYVLSIAIKLGRVVILTNADTEWLRITSKHYLPNASKFLSVLTIVSANEAYSSKTKDLMLWKYYSMCDILNDSPVSVDSLISVGDSNLERFASGRIIFESVGQKFPQTTALTTREIFNKPRVVSSLKFYDSPSLKELLSELNYVSRFLPYLISRTDYTDMRLWRYIDENKVSEEDKLIEMALARASVAPVAKSINSIKIR